MGKLKEKVNEWAKHLDYEVTVAVWRSLICVRIKHNKIIMATLLDLEKATNGKVKYLEFEKNGTYIVLDKL